MTVFAERLKKLRKEKKMSQIELAKAIGNDIRQISRYESENIVPYAETIVKIADFFEVTTDYLLIENAPRKPFRFDEEQLLAHLEEIRKLPDEDKKCLYHYIDALVAKNNIKSIAQKI